MLKFHVQEYERCLHYIMPACSKAAGRHIEQTFAVLDVKGGLPWGLYFQVHVPNATAKAVGHHI